RQRIGRRNSRLRLALSAGRGRRHDHLDVALLELGLQRGQLLVLELVLESKGLEDGLLDRPALLGLVEDGPDRYLIRDGAQFVSPPSLRGLRRQLDTLPRAQVETTSGARLFLEDRLEALEVASQLLAGLRRDSRAGQAEQAVRPPPRGDVQRRAPVRLLEDVVDYELDRASQGPQRQAPTGLEGAHLEFGIAVMPEEMATLVDAHAFGKRPVGPGLDRARLPLRNTRDVGQERKDVVGRARDLDRDVDPHHGPSVPCPKLRAGSSAGRAGTFN